MNISILSFDLCESIVHIPDILCVDVTLSSSNLIRKASNQFSNTNIFVFRPLKRIVQESKCIDNGVEWMKHDFNGLKKKFVECWWCLSEQE